MSQITEITVQEAEALIENQGAMVLDTRDQRDYMSSHHPEAINLSDHNTSALIKRTPKDKNIIVYCYLGHSSIEKAKMFADFGFKHCFSVKGGFTAWKKFLKLKGYADEQETLIKESEIFS